MTTRMITDTQRKTAYSVVNLFETGEVLGDYGQVTVITGDTGHLTFGRSQTTLRSGNLHELLQRYCANGGARFRERLKPYLPRFRDRDTKLDGDHKLHNLLRASADDPVMRDTQDVFFDDVYWKPASRAADREGITSPLGMAIVYDSFVHGSWTRLRDRTREQAGVAAGEEHWVRTYIRLRRDWLAGHRRADLRATVYRVEAFQRLIDQGYWQLGLPLVVRGKEISLSTLSALPPACYDGPQPGTRLLSLRSPMQRGLDVRLLQLGLSDHGVDIKADGIFGQTSVRRVKEYQSAQGLAVTGVADVALIAQLVNA